MKNIIIIILIFICCMTLYAGEKPIISVLDFYTEEGISKSEMRLFISLLSSALFQTKIYTVIDVSERESLLKELEFSMSECSDESCQLEIGRLLAAEAIIIGRIGRLGSRYVLSIKMLETNTGRAINTADGIYDTIDAMVDDVGTIADKLSSTHRDREEGVPEEEITETKETVVTEEDSEIAENEEVIEETTAEDIPIEPVPKPVKKRLISYSTGIEGGVKLITGELWEIFQPGIPAFVSFNLELNLAREKIGFGILSGLNFDHTIYEVPYPYHMLTIPLGVNCKYESGFILPFFLLMEITGGMTFSFVQYAEDIEIEDKFVIKPFACANLGIGFAFGKNIRFALGTGYMIIFYDNNFLTGLIPLARFEIHF